MGQVAVFWKPAKDKETMTAGMMMSSSDRDNYAIGITNTLNYLIFLLFYD
jgi:hypothetical protein